MNLHDFRSNYSLGKLAKADLNADPIQQFQDWLQQTIATGLKDPSAMVLATVDANGQPNQRYVLLKKVDQHGFTFFTDISSTKGQELSVNQQASLLFPWHQYERQVRVQGVAERLTKQEVESYFHSRPLLSQLAAASSQQSQAVDSRATLLDTFQQLAKQYDVDDGSKKNPEPDTEKNVPLETASLEKVPLPERWGGYRIKPHSLEFWQGGEHRLHDRFVYTRQAGAWSIQRLQP